MEGQPTTIVAAALIQGFVEAILMIYTEKPLMWQSTATTLADTPLTSLYRPPLLTAILLQCEVKIHCILKMTERRMRSILGRRPFYAFFVR